MKHRTKIEIIADILQSIMNDSTLSTSKVMYKSFLTYKQMKEYLPFLSIRNGNLCYVQFGFS
jgi:predicted transcriptional regulator